MKRMFVLQRNKKGKGMISNVASRNCMISGKGTEVCSVLGSLVLAFGEDQQIIINLSFCYHIVERASGHKVNGHF